MGELQRQRDTLDLWVSRSHLWAMASGTLVLALTTFALGFLIGRKTAPEHVAAADLSEGQLVELLARVEASSRPGGGVEEITFPDALAGGATPLSTEIPGDAAGVLAVQASGVTVAGDSPPTDPYTIRIADLPEAGDATALRDRLRGAGMPAWMGLIITNGKPLYLIAIGGFADAKAAEAKLVELGAALTATGLTGRVAPTPNRANSPEQPAEIPAETPEPEGSAGQ
jgi:hypothetical protein